MLKTLSRVATAEAGWPRLAFGAAAVAVGGVGVLYHDLASAPFNVAVPAAAAVWLAAMAVRVWIGPVQDEDPDEDLIY